MDNDMIGTAIVFVWVVWSFAYGVHALWVGEASGLATSAIFGAGVVIGSWISKAMHAKGSASGHYCKECDT